MRARGRPKVTNVCFNLERQFSEFMIDSTYKFRFSLVS